MLMVATKRRSAKPAQKKEKKISINLTPLAIWLLPQILVGIAASAFYYDLGDEAKNYLSLSPLILSAVIMLIVYRKRIATDAKRINKGNRKLGFIIGFAFLTLLANFISTTVISSITGSSGENQESLEASAKTALLLTTVVALVTAPINEEFVFRDMLHKILKKDWLFYPISAVLFGLIHVSFNLLNAMIIPYIFVGLGCAYVFRKTEDNIVASMLVHFINNAVAMAIMLIML